MRKRRRKRRGPFCDQAWIERQKQRKRREYLDRGEPIPRWLQEPKPEAFKLEAEKQLPF